MEFGWCLRVVWGEVGKTVSFRLPCDATVAETFVTSFTDGEYAIYEKVGVTGSDVATPYNQTTVMIKSTAGLKTYLNLATKSTSSEDDIYAALLGATFNGVKADEMAIISMRTVA